METVETKSGQREVGGGGNGFANADVFGAGPDPFANRVSGDVVIEDKAAGRKFLLRPTFEAALQIEDALGTGVDGLRAKAALSGMPGAPALTSREIGVVMAAGIRATGEGRADVEKATKLAWQIGREALRKPILDFLWALAEGGRGRAEDLEKRGSSQGSLDADEAMRTTTNELIGQLSRSESSLE